MIPKDLREYYFDSVFDLAVKLAENNHKFDINNGHLGFMVEFSPKDPYAA